VHDDLGARPVKMRFTAVRRGVPLTPAYDPRVHLPVVHMQSALVVGPEKEEVCCDQMGRVRIRFPATRGQDHEHAAGCGASNTDRDSAWVRVASNWAGNGPGSDQCGALFLPRVGSEVLVAFMGGDPDKPVIVGQMFNRKGMPPEFTGKSGLPGNRYLSGIRSKEVHGGRRGNQLRFDDTKGEISVQLSSDHAESELNLGFLTQPKKSGYAEKRGDGAELRSNQQVVIRGEQGVLVTAEKSDSKTGTQLDRAELLNIAEGLEKLARELSERATQHAADKTTGEPLTQLVETIRSLAHSGAPVVAVSGPAGLIAGSSKNIAIGASTDIDVLSVGSTNIGAGDVATMRAAQGISVFANEGGLKLTAASGKVGIQAQNDMIEIVAQKVLEIISNTDWITIKAKRGVRINGGGTELELSPGGIKGYTSGKHHIFASAHQTFEGKEKPLQFAGDKPIHKVCIPCLRIAAQAHSPFAPSK
jgi:type VI secretion system secreted protein VgrG